MTSSDANVRVVDPAGDSAQSDEPFHDLKRRVEITRDARFQANLRMERRQKASYYITSILSLFVIVLSLVPNVYILSPAASQALLSLTIVNSVFIIITTFMEASGNFVHKGEQLHRSARKIASVFNKLMLLTQSERYNKERIKELQSEYQSALDDCPFNHENLDYDKIKATKPSLFKGRIYEGPGAQILPFFRILIYRIQEYSWTAPHLMVFGVTILVLYWLLFEGGLGEVRIITEPK